jgi:F-type H+-transporting ATPase subunit gamma
MATLKELKTKIASLSSTQKMTKTMKLVAASRMRKATMAQENAKDYALKLEELMANVAGSSQSLTHPLLNQNSGAGKALMLVIASDRGLCGGFNNNLFRTVKQWLKKTAPSIAENIEFSFCGRRAYSYFRNETTVKDYYEGVTDRPKYTDAARIGDELMQAYESGEYDAIYVSYSRYKNALVQFPTITKLLPIDAEDQPQAGGEAKAAESDYLYEPAVAELMADMLPNAVKFRLYNMFLENGAGEHAARMTAMDSATRSAGDLIDHYTLIHNRERQAAITSELIDIVVGAESL